MKVNHAKPYSQHRFFYDSLTRQFHYFFFLMKSEKSMRKIVPSKNLLLRHSSTISDGYFTQTNVKPFMMSYWIEINWRKWAQMKINLWKHHPPNGTISSLTKLVLIFIWKKIPDKIFCRFYYNTAILSGINWCMNRTFCKNLNFICSEQSGHHLCMWLWYHYCKCVFILRPAMTSTKPLFPVQSATINWI